MAGEEIGDRIGRREAQRRGGDREDDRPQEGRAVEAGERGPVVLEGEGELDAAEDAAREREHHGEAKRREEEHRQPGSRYGGDDMIGAAG